MLSVLTVGDEHVVIDPCVVRPMSSPRPCVTSSRLDQLPSAVSCTHDCLTPARLWCPEYCLQQRRLLGLGYLPAARSNGDDVRDPVCSLSSVKKWQPLRLHAAKAGVLWPGTWQHGTTSCWYAGFRQQDWLSPELVLHNRCVATLCPVVQGHIAAAKGSKWRAEAAVTASVKLTSSASRRSGSRVQLTYRR